MDDLWYKDAIIYQTHVRCFFDSNDDGIGDFQGLIDKLDYIRELGVTAIWLLPFYPSPLRDDGYDIASYTDVHPDYGTLADFSRFVQEAHARELRVITELVINHTSDQHPWFQAARRAAPGSPEREFYVWSETDQKFPETRIIFTDTETSNWTWDPVAKAYYWHRFFSHQPDLNHNNPRVVEAVIELMHFWLELGVDGLRLDAIPYLCVREGTNNENLPETHAVIKQLRAAMDARYPGRMLLAEANQWPEDAREYFGDGDECQLSFHFPLMPRLYMAVAQEDRYPITEIMRQTPEIPDNCQWAIFLRNHDELTLEMVTDHERDYMYRVYATDPRMRCNVGIRRRLAPLLENDVEKIRLLQSLLLSMLGTPIIYYGDELGMGDNIFLGDRNGVRTPMQWSVDRNGGFSKADPGRLYLPPIMDPLYGFQALNVEAQQRDPNSQLHWLRELIAVRQGQRVFSRGQQTFLYPGNRKILAYLREFEGETVLCVANLSRRAQPVELDLAAYRGHVPVELLGRTPFPPLGELPYLLTLPGYGFYWFRLTDEVDAPRWHVEQEPPPPDMPYLVMRDGWSSLLAGQSRRELERLLPDYLRRQRWFTAKGSQIERVEIDALGLLGDDARWQLLSVTAHFASSGTAEAGAAPVRPAQRYFLPLAIAWEGADAAARNAQTVDPLQQLGGLVLCGVRRANRTGLLFDAMHDEVFVRALARRAQEGGADLVVGLPATPSETVAPAAPVRWIEGASNTTCTVDERLLLKVYRQLLPGAHPEPTLGRRLTGLPFVAAMHGALELVVGEERYALGILQQRVSCQDDAWHYLLDHLARFLDLAETLRTEEHIEELEGFFTLLSEMHRLGQRTAELHLALATDAQPLSGEELSSLRDRIAGELEATVALVGSQLPGWSEEQAGLGRRFLALAPTLSAQLAAFAADPTGLVACPIHGDLHLGQVLVHEHDFIFIDFEGETTRPLAERCRVQSPLKDLAGLLRSIDYAAHTALRDLVALRAERGEGLSAWLRRWRSLVLDALRAGYAGQVNHSNLSSPQDPHARALLELYVLEKALYELRYEIDHRPDWIRVPLWGLLETFGERPVLSKEQADG